MQLASVPRKPCCHHDKFVIAAQAAPLSRGLALGITVFAYHDNLVNNRIILHAITMAKTRATAMLRQQHLPPNVMLKPDIALNNYHVVNNHLFSHKLNNRWYIFCGLI